MYRHTDESNTHEASVSPTVQTPQRESVAKHGTLLLIVLVRPFAPHVKRRLYKPKIENSRAPEPHAPIRPKIFKIGQLLVITHANIIMVNYIIIVVFLCIKPYLIFNKYCYIMEVEQPRHGFCFPTCCIFRQFIFSCFVNAVRDDVLSVQGIGLCYRVLCTLILSCRYQ